MKKIIHSCLTISFLFSTIPMPVFATQTINTPPIYVSVLKLNEQVSKIKKDVLNQERNIRDEEILARQLSQENSTLIADIQKKGESSDLFTNIDSMKKLKVVMEDYNRKMDERNRLMMDRSDEIGALKARIEKLEHLFDEVIKLSKNVEAMKNPTVEQVQEGQDLTVILENQKELLNAKDKYLEEKDQQLDQYITQLKETREQLVKLKAIQGESLKDSQDQGQKYQTIVDQLTTQTQRFTQLQDSLQDKDAQLKQLEDIVLQKDQEIAELKNALAQANQKLAQAEVEIAQVKQELSMQQEAAVVKDQMTQEQEQLIDSLHKEVVVVKKGIEDMRSNYDQDVQGFDRIRDNIILLKQKLTDAQARAARMEEQDNELVKLKGEMAALTYQLENAQTDLSDYQMHEKSLNMTIEKLNVQLALKDQDLQTKNSQIVELQSQVKEIDTYKDQIKTLRASIASLQEQVASLQEEVLALTHLKEKVALEDILISKYRILEDLLEQKCDLLKQLANKHKDRGDYYKEQLKATIVYWHNFNEQNEVKFKQLTQQMSEQQKYVETLQAQLQDSSRKAVELESMLDVYQRKADDKDLDLKEKTVYIDQLQGELQTAQEGLAKRESDLQKVREYFFEFEKRFTEKTQQLREKNQQLALLSASLDDQKEKFSISQNRLKQMQERLTVAETKLRETP